MTEKWLIVEICDFDAMMKQGKVETALRPALGTPDDDRRVKLLNSNKRKFGLAVVILDEADAVRLKVPRCYQCLGYGHPSKNCKGKECSLACFKCEEK